jgi:hypothetical protein
VIAHHPSIAMIETAAMAFEQVPGIDVVYVGGATTCLYIDDPALHQVRTTKDVDCTLELATYPQYSTLEKRLRAAGFAHVIDKDAPLCRWAYKGLLMDIMPDDERVIGFSNSWYEEGRKRRISIQLPSHRQIYIFPPEYFIASKIEAFNHRGNNDFYGSKDMEDIINVLDGTTDVKTIPREENRATVFVKRQLAQFLHNQDFMQSLAGHIEHGDTSRIERIVSFIRSFTG